MGASAQQMLSRAPKNKGVRCGGGTGAGACGGVEADKGGSKRFGERTWEQAASGVPHHETTPRHESYLLCKFESDSPITAFNS